MQQQQRQQSDHGSNGGARGSFWTAGRSAAALGAATAVAAAGLAFHAQDARGSHVALCQSAAVAPTRRSRPSLVYVGAPAKSADAVPGLAQVGDKREPDVDSVKRSVQQRTAVAQLSDPAALAAAMESLDDEEDDAVVVTDKKVPEPEKASVEEPEEEPEEDPLPAAAAALPTLACGAPAFVPYLIVGGGVAAIAAARSIRAHDPTARVLIVSKEHVPPYLRPPLSKELWRRSNKRVQEMLSPAGDMKEHSWMYFEPDCFYLSPQQLVSASHGGVGLWSGRCVTALDVDANSVTLDSGETIEFGACLLATGGRPRRLPQLEAAPAAVQERVRYFRSVEDFTRLRAEARTARRVTVIGGGFLGTELAVSLAESAKRDLSAADGEGATERRVTQLFKEHAGCLAHVLPTCLAAHTERFVQTSGVDTRSGVTVVSAVPEADDAGNGVELTLSDGSHLGADLLVVAVGLDASTELADGAGLELDERQGGYLVNAELRARNKVWVAGDASSYYDVLLGRRRVEHINHAEESGRMAGLNMTGGREAYRHQSSFWSSLGPGMTWDAVGRVDAALQTYAFFAQPAVGDTTAAPDYSYPGVVFYVSDGRLVGVLLWNLSDELYRDPKKFAPSRLHLARSLLAARHAVGGPDVAPVQLEALAKQFDLYATVDDDYQELLKYVELKEAERQAKLHEETVKESAKES